MAKGQNILVLGGTRFFGRMLVERLLGVGHRVTVATRGNNTVPHHGNMTHITLDRADATSMQRATAGRHYEVVYDQLAFCADDVRDAIEVFNGRVGHYVLTSSSAVYADSPGLGLDENTFDPRKHPVVRGRYPKDVDYAGGKRGAEAALFQRAPFPVAAVRFPMVVGVGDPTGRLQHLIRRLQAGLPFTLPPVMGKLNFISSQDAGDFLAHVGGHRLVGPFNAASPDAYAGKQVIDMAAAALGVQPRYAPTDDPDARTGYARDFDMVLDTDRAKATGYVFKPMSDWLSDCVLDVAQAL
ncbi:MAG: NAD-dependent epimerase/dehydratase family protein [Phycisphaera sp.]|nr:NAD-dependent epimerase/dehydratase family protein [Phycisphaera sp.]